MKKTKSIFVPVICTVAILLLFRSIFFLGYVPSTSMEPTIHSGHMILGTRMYGNLRNDDIIIFEHDGRLLVKRIAASSGDTVIRYEETITVPEKCYYVLGDNAEDSFDSRYWQDPFVREESIVAKLICY